MRRRQRPGYLALIPPRSALPRLPALVEQKLTKTGYTRGATVREIYQNRVTRNSTVLIRYDQWDLCWDPEDGSLGYENGFIVLLDPEWYFSNRDADDLLAESGIELGQNALLLYQRRHEWESFGPSGRRSLRGKPFRPATSRLPPLGGIYLARVHGTVSDDGLQITEGFDTNRLRGAGIRVFEYASTSTIADARLQLEALIWRSHDSTAQMEATGMSEPSVRRTKQLTQAEERGLLDLDRLRTLRMIDDDGFTVCPLCLQRITVSDFLKRTEQAEGRETYDLTTTEMSLFHIQELRVGKLQHKPYNLGWGHHFCNVVTKDAGIMRTLAWMKGVLDNQALEDIEAGSRLVEEAVEG